MPTFSITDQTGKIIQISAPRMPTEAELRYVYAHPQHALPQTLTAPVRLNLDPQAQEQAVEPLETAPGALLAPRRAASTPQPVGPMQLLTGVTSAPAAAGMGSLADDPGDALKAIHAALETAWRAPITPTDEQPTMGGELEKRGVPMNPLLKGAVDIWTDPANMIGGGPEDIAKAGMVAGTAGAKGLGRLFSRLTEEVLPRFKAKAAHPSRIMSDVKNFGSPMEAEWTGLTDWLRGKGNTPVTREEFEQFAKSNPLKLEESKYGFPAQNPDAMDLGLTKPRWRRSDLNLPGGENYREIVLRLPFTKEQEAAIRAKGYSPSDQEAARLGGGFSHGSHWPGQANPLTHLRLNDRVTADGKKALHIEELQSDWHQQGREKGYKDSTVLDAATGKLEEAKTGYKSAAAEAVAALESAGYRQYSRYSPEHLDNPLRHTAETGAKEGLSPEIIERIKSARENLNTAYERLGLASGDWNAASGKLSVAVPDAPYKGTAWAELGLKRALIEAVESGKDELTWTTGRQQSERYGNLLESVTAVRHNADGWQVKNGKEWIDAGDGELAEVRRFLPKDDQPKFDKWRSDREAIAKSGHATMSRAQQHEDALRQLDVLAESRAAILANMRDGLMTEYGVNARSAPLQPDEIVAMATQKATANESPHDTAMARRINEYKSNVASASMLKSNVDLMAEMPAVKNATFKFSAPLEVGSSGMRQHYDEVMVNSANKIGKPHGAQVKKTKVLVGKKIVAQLTSPTAAEEWERTGHVVTPVETSGGSKALRIEKPEYEEIHSLPITEKLRKQVLEKGLPLAAAVPLAMAPQQKTKGETTHLAPRDEAKFQSWVKANKIPDVDAAESYYDYRGYWKKYGDKPVKFGKEHFTDEFKQHGHPTFSVESKYSRGKQDGGQWVGDTLVPAPVASHRKN